MTDGQDTRINKVEQNSSIKISCVNTEHDRQLLGFCFDESLKAGMLATANSKLVNLPLEVLDKSVGFGEYWLSEKQSTVKVYKDYYLIQNDDFLSLAFVGQQRDIAELTTDIYTKAYQISEQHDFQHLLRTWNFFPKINEKTHSVENYQQFCISRHEVLKQYEQLETDYPAATAIGSKNSSYCFVFLFSKRPGKVIENSRQVSAWQYPLKYSPKQPTFSRAIMVSDLLICSGTASVVGHETHHENNFNAQFNESLANVEAILKTSHCTVQSGSGLFKFYLRDKERLPQLTELIKASVINKYVILFGDICRTSLLLECEAVFQLTNT